MSCPRFEGLLEYMGQTGLILAAPSTASSIAARAAKPFHNELSTKERLAVRSNSHDFKGPRTHDSVRLTTPILLVRSRIVSGVRPRVASRCRWPLEVMPTVRRLGSDLTGMLRCC